MMEHLLNDDLECMLPDWKGNPFDGTEFQYLENPFKPQWKHIANYMLTRNPQGREKRQDKWRPKVQTDTSFLDSPKDFIVWLGHASFLIQVNGKRLLTDPAFYNLALIQRRVGIPFGVEQFANLDYLLISHDHRDHCDKKSIKQVLKHANPSILTCLKMSNTIKNWVGQTPIQEAAWYQIYKTEGVEVIYLPARHWSRRGLTDFNRVLWGSFLIRVNDKTIYFGGDSSVGNHFEEIGKLFPDIDVCMLGIGAYKPAEMMQAVHTSPQQAYEAFLQLGAKQMIPMHYGTYDLSWEPASEPYRMIHELFEQANKTESLLALDIGEPFFI